MIKEGEKPKILLVDDEKYQRGKYQELLEKHNYKVIPAGSVEEALKILDEQSVNLVLTDIVLGKGKRDGFELLKEIKNKYKNLPVMGMSFTAPKLEYSFRKEGGDEFFVKPKFWKVADEELLLQKIKRCL